MCRSLSRSRATRTIVSGKCLQPFQLLCWAPFFGAQPNNDNQSVSSHFSVVRPERPSGHFPASSFIGPARQTSIVQPERETESSSGPCLACLRRQLACQTAPHASRRSHFTLSPRGCPRWHCVWPIFIWTCNWTSIWTWKPSVGWPMAAD